MRRRAFLGGLGASLVAPSLIMAQGRLAVDTALVMATDVSASIVDDNYNLQKKGIAQALTGKEMKRVLDSTIFSINYMEWSSKQWALGWHVVTNMQEAQEYAHKILSLQRSSNGITNVLEAVQFSVALHEANPFPGHRRVIDVSGDGPDNANRPQLTREATLKAADSGYVINGLPILGNDDKVEEWYDENVVAGSGSFMVTAHGFEDFEKTMVRKLVVEIV